MKRKTVELDYTPVAPDNSLAEKFTTRKNITIRLDYPLDKPYDFKFSSKNGFSVGRVISLIQRAYANVYQHPDKYGVWGHDIGDLVIETITDMGTHIDVGIGS